MNSRPVRTLTQAIGPRIAKTGLAVLGAMALWHWLVPPLTGIAELDRQTSFAGISAFLAVQPSVVRSRTLLGNQVMGNLLGAAIGLPLGYLLGPHPGTVALGVVLLLVLVRHLHLLDLANMAVITLIVVLAQPGTGGFLFIGFARLAAVILGTGVGLLVNRWVLRPDYATPLRRQLALAADEVARFFTHLETSLQQPETLKKETVKADAARVQAALDQARSQLDLYVEETAPDEQWVRILRKTVQTLSAMVDKGSDIHRADLRLGGLPPAVAADVAAVFAALGRYRSLIVAAVVARIDARAATEGPDSDELQLSRGPVDAALARLHRHVVGLVADPPSRQLGLVVHAMYTSLAQIVHRLDDCDPCLSRPGTPRPPRP